MKSDRAKQLSFQTKGFNRPQTSFGGEAASKSNPKTKRPLDSKLPIFLTLRANQGGMRLPKTYSKVSEAIESTTKKYGVRVYEEANVGNHIHMVIKLTKISLWAPFIRELTGRIAQAVIQAGVELKAEKFWKFRPHTRIVQGWQKAYRVVKDYVYLNQLEAEGIISRAEISSLKDLKEILNGT